MKNYSSLHRIASGFVPVLIGSVAIFSALPDGNAAVVTSSFETSDGNYVNGTDVAGKTDSSLGGTWSAMFDTPTLVVTSSTMTPYTGVLDIHINDNNTGAAYGAQLQVSNAASFLTDDFTFSIAMNVHSASATGGEAQVYFGNSVIGNGSHWLRLSYNAGNVSMITGNGSGTYTSINLASYSTLSNLGDYIVFSLTVDPATHKYTNVTLSGTKTTLDVTSAVLASNGGMIPWNGTTPGAYLSLLTGTTGTANVYFDTFAIVPEPSVLTLGVLGACFLAISRDRKRRADLALA